MKPGSVRLAVLGASGHGKVVAATALEAGFEVVGFYDDDESKWQTRILGVPVRGPIPRSSQLDCAAILGIGDNRTRRALANAISADWATVIHPTAYVHGSARLGAGTVVLAGAVVQPDARVGEHAIVNTGATVDHDCRLGAYVHCGPGSHLAGGVAVGEGALLGVGCSVCPGVEIGSWSILGAGSTATEHIAAERRAVGSPARLLPEP